MKIPKKIDNLLKRKCKLAQQLCSVSLEVDEWLISKGVDLQDPEICDAVLTGALIYCEPATAQRVVHDYIENYM